MPSLSIGPPPLGPNDPPVCAHGFTSAVQTALRLTVSTPAGAILWVVLVSLAVTLSNGFVEGDGATDFLNALIGVALGTAAAYGLLTLWLWTPLSRWYHWSDTIRRYDGEGSETTHSLFSLKSRHLHFAHEIICSVADPLGQTYTHAWRSSIGANPPIRRGDGPTIAYPDQFDAPWPITGRYRVLWILRTRDGRERTLRTRTWAVRNEP